MPRIRCLPAMLSLALTAGPALTAVESDPPPPPQTPADAASETEGGKASRPFFGVTIASDDAGAAFDTRGVLIDSVIVGSTADTLGLAVGDRLLSLNDIAVANAADLQRATNEIGVGGELTIELERKGEAQSLTGTMQAFPSKEIWESRIEEQRERKRGLGGDVATETREANQRRWRNLVLAGVVRRTADALAALPGRIETATREYKRVYPDGDFDIRLNVHIASTSEEAEPAEDAIDSAGEAPGDDPTAEAAEGSEQTDATDAVNDATGPTTDAKPATASDAPQDGEAGATSDAPQDGEAGATSDAPQDGEAGAEAGSETGDPAEPAIGDEPAMTDPHSAGRRTRRFSTAAQQTGAATLATAMAELAATLEQLPGELQQTAEDFKQAYPDGVFRIDVAVSIVPDPDAADVLRLGPGADDQAPADDAAADDASDAGDDATDAGDVEPEQDPDSDATEGAEATSDKTADEEADD